jgi:hypothetical protein
MTFDMFKAFIEDGQLLSGLNLTVNLQRQLFGHLDPHKKGYLEARDWKLAFGKDLITNPS